MKKKLGLGLVDGILDEFEKIKRDMIVFRKHDRYCLVSITVSEEDGVILTYRKKKK